MEADAALRQGNYFILFVEIMCLISIVKRLCVTATDRQKYYILVKSQTTGEEII